jgi:hypothetical protein
MPFWDFLRRRSGRGRPAHEPKRDTLAWPNLSTLGQASPQAQRIVFKPVPKNLRYFSRTPIARRSINAIPNPIAQLEWEIAPVNGIGRRRHVYMGTPRGPGQNVTLTSEPNTQALE